MLSEKIREEVKEYLRRRGISKAELARRAGISVKTLENFLKGRSLTAANLEKIYSVLDRDRDYLLEEENRALVYDSVAAGQGREIFRDLSAKILLPDFVLNKSRIALRVRGNSMFPALVDGAIVGVDTSQKHIQHGKMYVFYLPWKGFVVKRAIVIEGGKILLKSDNEDYPDIVVEDENEAYVIGKVVWSVQVYS